MPVLNTILASIPIKIITTSFHFHAYNTCTCSCIYYQFIIWNIHRNTFADQCKNTSDDPKIRKIYLRGKLIKLTIAGISAITYPKKNNTFYFYYSNVL